MSIVPDLKVRIQRTIHGSVVLSAIFLCIILVLTAIFWQATRFYLPQVGICLFPPLLVFLLALLWKMFPPQNSKKTGIIAIIVNGLAVILMPIVLIVLGLRGQIGEGTLVCSCTFFAISWLSLGKLVELLIQQHFLKPRSLIENYCPEIFSALSYLKGIIFIFPLLFIGIFYLAKNTTDDAVGLATVCLGFCILFMLPFFPAYFVKQNDVPNEWEKFCRKYFLFWSPGARIIWYFAPKEHQKAFMYWLSHPGIEMTEQHIQKAANTDISKFDWQNPKEWPF